MASANEQFETLMRKAKQHHDKALWQEKLRVVQQALQLCHAQDFPDATRREQDVLLELGGIKRRLGQYDDGIELLKRAMSVDANANELRKATILGELGVLYRHRGDFAMAMSTFQQQFEIADGTTLDAEAERCRAIGNEGMAVYNLSQESASPPNLELLRSAEMLLKSRIERAELLHRRLSEEDPAHKYFLQSRIWEIIGMDRLSLVYIAMGNSDLALQWTEQSQRLWKEVVPEPTVFGFSQFFYGNALWHHDRYEDARAVWNQKKPGTCAAFHSCCKEPCAELTEYMKIMAKAGVDFNGYDEQGFSALDYAVLSDNPDANDTIGVIMDSFRRALEKELQVQMPQGSRDEIRRLAFQETNLRFNQAEIRRWYRTILQEEFRPELRSMEVGAVPKLREIYSNLLDAREGMRKRFDDFYFVTYQDFRDLRRLPTPEDQHLQDSKQISRKACSHTSGAPHNDVLFVVFFSYRWIGIEHGRIGPDDGNNSQYRRMLQALQSYQEQKHLDPKNIGIWLDCACIDQHDSVQRDKGINSLAFAVTQCDAMISLVDEAYAGRAWCAVEVMLMRNLIHAYGVHDHWDHVLNDAQSDRVKGTLQPARERPQVEVNKLALTSETDRASVDFLVRQKKREQNAQNDLEESLKRLPYAKNLQTPKRCPNTSTTLEAACMRCNEMLRPPQSEPQDLHVILHALTVAGQNPDSASPESERHKALKHLGISEAAFKEVLQGVVVAAKISEDLNRIVSDWIEQYAKNETTATADDGWQTAITNDQSSNDRNKTQILNVTLGVTILRERSRRGLEHSTEAIDRAWNLIHGALTDEDADGLQWTASRSAQGFLAVPLCSLIADGKIKELFRLHVWLPDGQRGAPEAAIHSHQPFAQSWILAGEGTDVKYDAQRTADLSVATHAEYVPQWSGTNDKQGNTTTYKTHQISSTVVNTGKLLRIVKTGQARHTMDMTYSIDSGVYHQSIVPPAGIHATLFYFDASRGFLPDAAAAGPIRGKENTQLRDPAGATAPMLAELTSAVRVWEKRSDCSDIHREDEQTVAMAYWRRLQGQANGCLEKT